MRRPGVPNFLCPPPLRQGKTFCAPDFKEWKPFVPFFNMAEASTYCVTRKMRIVDRKTIYGEKMGDKVLMIICLQ